MELNSISDPHLLTGALWVLFVILSSGRLIVFLTYDSIHELISSIFIRLESVFLYLKRKTNGTR